MTKKPKYHDLSPETMDGILYGLELERRLNNNPEARSRNENYKNSVKSAYAFALSKDKEYIISVLKWHNDAYLIEILKTHEHKDLADRFAHTFWKGYAIEYS